MTRIQLRLRGAAEHAFNEMSGLLQVDTKEIVMDALALLHFALQELREGRRVGSLDPVTREFKSVALFTLSAAAKQAQPPTPVASGAGATA